MKDRIPTYPGRVKMTLQDGTVQYVTLERADEPTQVGTPINRANLLTDETAVAIGLSAGANPTPNDAFNKLGVTVATNYNNTLKAATKTAMGLASTAVPDDAFQKLIAKDTALGVPKLLYSKTVAGNASYQVPSNGSVKKVLVAIIGGGGSGALMFVNSSYATYNAYAASGASGAVKVFAINVSANQLLSGVVGAGGVAAAVSQQAWGFLKSGNAGGSTSFAQIVAPGGGGGRTFDGSGNAYQEYYLAESGGQMSPFADSEYSYGRPVYYFGVQNYKAASSSGGIPQWSQAMPELVKLLAYMPIENFPFVASIPQKSMDLDTGGSVNYPQVTLPNGKKNANSVHYNSGNAVTITIPAAYQVLTPTDPGSGGGHLIVFSTQSSLGSVKLTASSGKGADGGIFVYDITGR